jgi:hypothetical protein
MINNQLKIGNRKVWMHKAIKNVDFGSESVLSNDPWLFVSLWLKREKKEKALAFWNQARRFHEASLLMSIEAAPLAAYYCLLNATKTLLLVRSSNHKDIHGVSGDRAEKAKAYLGVEKIKFGTTGVLPALCGYLGESSVNTEYSLKDLLWNLPFVHRAFRHTYSSAAELFIPIQNACYIKHSNSSEAWFQASVVPRYCDDRILRHIPKSFEYFGKNDEISIRRKKRFDWVNGKHTRSKQDQAIRNLISYHSSIRRLIVPITGNSDLWYLKKNLKENPVAERHSLTIIFAAMHRLSELSRYDPNGLERHLNGNSNWLLTEFIQLAPSQFIDQISSEITGLQFWKPGYRS